MLQADQEWRRLKAVKEAHIGLLDNRRKLARHAKVGDFMKNGHKPKLVDNLSNTSLRAVVMNSSKLNQSAKAICTEIDKTARTINDCSHHPSRH